MQVGHPGARSRSTGARVGAGWSTTTSRRPSAWTRCPSRRGSGGTAPRAGRTGRMGGLALGGPVSFFLGGVVTRDHRAPRCPAPAGATSDVPGARRPGGLHGRRPRHDSERTGRHDRAPAADDRSDRRWSCPSSTTRPCAPGEGGAVVLVPSIGWAERLAPASSGGGTRPRGLGGGPGGLAGGGRRAERRRGPRCPGWPLPSSSTPTTSAYREESAPTYSAVEVLLERARPGGCPVHPRRHPVPARRSGAAGRTAHGAHPRPMERAAGRRSNGWTAGVQTRGRACSPSEFVRLARSRAGRRHGLARGPWCVCTNRTGRRSPAGLSALRGAGPLCPLRCRGRSARPTRRCCGAPAAARSDRSCARRAGGCA